MAADRVSFYDVLLVKPSASQEEIRSAYRRHARAVHPDRHLETAHFFRLVREAYEVLGDPRRRELYDRERAPTSATTNSTPTRQATGEQPSCPAKAQRAPGEPNTPAERSQRRRPAFWGSWAAWVVVSGSAVWGFGQFGHGGTILVMTYLAVTLLSLVAHARWTTYLVRGCWALAGLCVLMSVASWAAGHLATSALLWSATLPLWGALTWNLSRIDDSDRPERS